MKKSKVWLVQTPRLPDKLAWGIKEVSNLFSKHGYDNDIIDVNHDIYQKFYDTDSWRDIDDFGIDSKFRPAVRLTYNCIRDSLKVINKGDTVIVSVFSTESRPWSNITVVLLREKYKKEIRIGFGGPGCRNPGEKEYQAEWCDRYLNNGLVDFVILGESSAIIKEICSQTSFRPSGKMYQQGSTFPDLGFLPKKLVIDRTKRIHSQDYSRRDLAGEAIGHTMDENEKITLHFTQGCVKKCTFCDVPYITPQWAMRSAEQVLEELEYYYNMTGQTAFAFPDNTINGSDSEFLKFLNLLYKWQERNEPITWSSQFGVKQSKQQTNEMIELIAKTNGKLSVGFDHCSDPVLSHMKKLYQWRDIENFIKQCHRYNVDVKTAMWIVGYPTETVTDILEYKKLFRLIKTYDVITSHSVVVCSINRNSSLLKNVQIDWHNPKDWISNTGLTKSMRIRRKNWVDNNLLALDQFYYRLETTQKREK